MGVKSGRRNLQEAPVPVRVLWGGNTPLHEAAIRGDISEVKALLAKGAEVDAKNKYGETPLDLAIDNGHWDVVKAFLAKGAEVDAKDRDGETPLHRAARWGHLDVVKVLLAKGAEVNAKDEDSETPLHEAASKGHLDVVKALLAKGAEVDAKNKYGKTPLLFAAWHDHLDVVKALLSKGAEVNAKTKDGSACWFGCGWTPLHYAAKYGHLDVVNVLLAHGADTNAKSRHGTPLHLAHDEDVLKAFGQHFIKLAEHAKKSKELKEAPKIVIDTLQARCLPEVAQWAVNHSYAIDDFPGDASMARSCMLQYMNFPTRARAALGSKWSYVFPGAGAAAAAVSVFMVEPLILCRFGSVDASDDEETHKFYRGAHLLVAKAAIKESYHDKLAFRLFEVITIIGFFMGFAMVELWWVPWLPFVGLLFLLPGMYDSKELIRAPVKCIASTNTPEGYMWSFLRLVLIWGAHKGVEATTGWRRREANPWDFFSLKMEFFVNPMYEGLQDKMKRMWPEATLQPFLRATFPGLDPVEDPFVKSLWQINAMDISELGKSVLFLSLSVYGCSLLVRMLHQCCKVFWDAADINHASYAKKLARCPTDKVPGFIKKIKQKEPHHLQVKPIGKCSLAFKLPFVALDVYFDVNTIRTLILSSNLRFACALTFVVARSAFREWNNFSGLKEAVCESYERGMLHEKLIDLLEEEKGAEAFFSLSITSYSYVYCVQTGKQAVVQWLSILSAAYGIAEFLVQKMEFPTTEFPATEKVNSFVIVPSEEIQKEKGDA